MRSEQTGALAKALADAQAAIKPPKKGRTAKIKSDKGAYEYHYADLADVIESYREPLSKHALALTQTTRIQDGHLVLVTTLLHGSGEWVASEYPITSYARPQEQGSAITYARRYAVTALLGIAAEDDDDGQAAQDATPQRTTAKTPVPTPGAPKLTNNEVESIHTAAKRAGLKSTGELGPVLFDVCGATKAAEVPRSQYQAVMDRLQVIADGIPA